MGEDGWWLLVGFGGQALFMGRFVLQWFVSERARRSVIPVGFWYLSILGALVLLAASARPGVRGRPGPRGGSLPAQSAIDSRRKGACRPGAMSARMARVLPKFTVAPHFFNLLHNRIYIIALLAVHVLAGPCCPDSAERCRCCGLSCQLGCQLGCQVGCLLGFVTLSFSFSFAYGDSMTSRPLFTDFRTISCVG
jgi:hypothetical protein